MKRVRNSAVKLEPEQKKQKQSYTPSPEHLDLPSFVTSNSHKEKTVKKNNKSSAAKFCVGDVVLAHSLKYNQLFEAKVSHERYENSRIV